MSVLDLSGHRTVVIGATGAIGAAICRTFAEAGASVFTCDLDAGASAALAGELPGEHDSAGIDVTDLAGVEAAAERAFGSGPVDSVIYAAGVSAAGDVIDTDWPVFERVMDINLNGAVRVAQAFGSRMVSAGRGGSIVFLSSTAGKRGTPGESAYAASKFALQGLTECFAAEVGIHEIRVNAICPHRVDTPMLRDVAVAEAAREGIGVEEMLDSYRAEAATRRLVDPAEVGATAAWLASPLSAGITGESVNVDGGALTG